MFEKQTQKTELMIVCDDKVMPYANYLIQLVGQKDDSEETIVGVKDGTVTAAIYTEKQYKDTLAKITSNTHILFVGNNKTTKEQAKFIPLKIDCYGMHFGWQGKRAVMWVDKTVKEDEYNDFVDYAKKYELKYQKINIPVVARAPLLKPGVGALVGGLIVAVPAIVNAKKSMDDIKEQQYRCLTIAVYMDGLQKFLEE